MDIKNGFFDACSFKKGKLHITERFHCRLQVFANYLQVVNINFAMVNQFDQGIFVGLTKQIGTHSSLNFEVGLNYAVIDARF